MNIKDKLQIMIVTNNRDIYLEKTLNFLTNDEAPVKECDICILDNKSSDNTPNVVKNFTDKFPNIKYIRHNYNIGGNANITRAFELNAKDYVWVLGDSYLYDWTNWAEVETAINNDEGIIIATRDAIPDDKKTIAAVLSESGFLSTCIFSKRTLEGIVIKLMYDNIYTMFPHVVPLVKYINEGGIPYILNKGIVRHGTWSGEEAKGKHKGWYRDFNPMDFYEKNRTMTYLVGMSIILSKLKDEELKLDTFETLYSSLQKLLKVKNPYKNEIKKLAKEKNVSQLGELYTYLKSRHCKNIDQYIIIQFPFHRIIMGLFFKLLVILKYVLYKVLCNITFGKTKEKIKKRKHTCKNLIN